MSYLNKNCSLGQVEESPFLAGRRAGTFNGFEVIPHSKVTRTSKGSYQRLCGWWTSQEGSGCQFLQTCQTEALQKGLRCGEAQTAVCPCEFLHKPEIAERHDKAALISVEKVVDLRLTDRLLKGDAGEHFERRGRESRIRARASLFA